MLDKDTLTQVSQIFSSLKGNFTLRAAVNPAMEYTAQLLSFLYDFAETSPHLRVEERHTENTPTEFEIIREDEPTGIIFRGIPTGHEFTSLLLAILNADGQGKNLPDEAIRARIEALRGEAQIHTFVSLTCTNCPDVVQALNLVALYNPGIQSLMIDGSYFPGETSRLNVQSVPTVLVNDKVLSVGRTTLGELLDKLESVLGFDEAAVTEAQTREYDVVVVGGGPAGVTSAIYSARKGLKTAIVCDKIGGQVRETVDIENLVSVPHTTGSELAGNLGHHLGLYDVDVFENRQIVSSDFKESPRRVVTAQGEAFLAPAVIIATGARWRRLEVPGEEEYIGRGVAFCPHCDGPFFQNKPVIVVGGGNSGIEAAIDLAGICSKVTVLEFAEQLKADKVLIDKAESLDNIEIITSAKTQSIIGNGSKVISLEYEDRGTGETHIIDVDGIFVQIGLMPNSSPFRDSLKINGRGEIVIDAFCRTSCPGVYAAGDVSEVPYKQIVIALGEGAKAALSAFDDRVRGLV